MVINSENCKSSLSIPVTSNMLTFFVKRRNIKGINDLKIYIEKRSIIVEVFFSPKLTVSLSTKIELFPISAHGRIIVCKLHSISPKWVNIFKVIPFKTYRFLSYKNGHLIIDLNKIPKIAAVKHGELIDIKIKNKLLWCKVKF
jgi:hypothetical protein